MVGVAAELAIVPATRALVALGGLDLACKLIACGERHAGHDEQLLEHGGVEGGKRIEGCLRSGNRNGGFLALVDDLGAASVLKRLGDHVAHLEGAAECGEHLVFGSLAGKRGHEVGAVRPAGQLHVAHAAFAVAHGLGITLPHLIGRERQDGRKHAHEHFQDVE